MDILTRYYVYKSEFSKDIKLDETENFWFYIKSTHLHIINHCLGLDHETMVCAVCLTMFLHYIYIRAHDSWILIEVWENCLCQREKSRFEFDLAPADNAFSWTHTFC